MFATASPHVGQPLAAKIHPLGRRLTRWLLSCILLVSLALLPGWNGMLDAQDLAVKFYGPQTGSGYQIHNALVQASDGNFYAAAAGGINRLTPEGVATSAYRFPALTASGLNVEGAKPLGGLLVNSDGNLYGLTSQGGASGQGTVFRFNPATGAVQTVAHLPVAPSAFGTLNSYPQSLVQDRVGNFFYLSASLTNSTVTEAIMKVTPAGSVSSLHVFSQSDNDGKNAEGAGFKSGIVIDGQDNLYGFTNGGGGSGQGTFYQVSPGGQATALYSYNGDNPAPNVADGRANSIVATNDGTIYGAAYGNGGSDNTVHGGSIFKAYGGQPVAIYPFSDGISQGDGSFRNVDGVSPEGLTLGPDGSLYGETLAGGANGSGTIFQVTLEGGFKLLYTFPPNAYSFTPPTVASNGDLYGTCYGDLGAFYRLGATLLPVFNAPTQIATATQGVQFSLQLVAANNPDTYTASGLPAGLTLDARTGLITGATTAILGDYPVALSATNSDGTSSAILTITVQAASPDAPVINVPSTPIGAVADVPFSYQIDATNKPTSYQISGLPSGVTFDPKTGLIHGLLANAGKIFLQVQAKNASGTGSASLEIDVAPANTLPIATLAATTDANAATGQTGVFTLTLSAAAGTDVVVAYTVKGSAVNGTDYALLKGTVKVKAGKTTKAIKVIPQGNLGGAAKKTVVLTLQLGTGYTVGTTGKVKLKITD